MKSFKVTGTPGEPVRLDTLTAGEWYTSAICPVPDGLDIIYPNMIVRYDGEWVITVRRDFSSGKDAADLLVHPLTRHEHDDGTVEFRHVGKEVECRDPRDVEHSLDVIGSAIDDIYSRLAVLESTTGKTTACNGTGVKPAPEPEPTYRKREIEAVTFRVDKTHDLSIGGWVFGAGSISGLRQAIDDYETYTKALASKGGAQ